MILKIIENINLILLAVAVISGFAMLGYLKDEGIARSRIIALNPLIFTEYIKITKEKTGKIGKWFWSFVVSLGLLIVFGITELVVTLINR
jgi:hypothetical protein